MAVVGFFERLQLVSTVQVSLELGDVPLLAKIAAHLVEDFHKHRKQSVDLSFADNVGLLVDIEQNAFGRDRHGLFE
ncbi:hypothetical protein ITH39_24900 [Salmonella enterica subsp. enterica serovar Weltevreden]|nr:hypothetical protein [Salmonella enterica subsp. enterica serovar Weltevreden]